MENSSSFVDRARTLGDANLADYLAHCALTSAGGSVRQTADDLMFAGGTSYPGSFSNGAVRRGSRLCDPVDFVDRSAEFFARMRRSYLVWVRDHLDDDLASVLVARGFTAREPVEGLTGVAVDVMPPVYAVPAGCEVRQVEDAAGRSDYLDVIADVYQLGDAPLPVKEGVLFPLDSLLSDDMGVFVLYEDGRAVSASANFISSGCGGMQWTGTRNGSLGRGYGKITCAAAWRFAFDRGQDLVVGQASAIGTPVWHSMGFRTVTRYRRFLCPPARR